MPKEDSGDPNKVRFPQGPDQHDPAFLLVEAIKQLIEMLNEKNSQKISEHALPIICQIERIETKQQQSVYHLEAIRKQLDVLVSNNKLLENASNINQTLSNQHYLDHIIEPMVRSILPVFDIIEDATKSWGISSEKADTRVPDFIDAVLAQMTQFLVSFNVHIIRHSINDKFDPQIMKPVKWIITDNVKLDGLIAQSLQIGFKFGQEKLLRFESVSLFKYKASQENKLLTITERKEDDNSRN